uniref:DDE_Tnp_1_7 domain-containing protein n=1 Tax=Strongyloides venezuelensis TaxID=75913 RepID=A0A0K0G3K5_STRVS
MTLYSPEHYKSGNCILTIYKSKVNLKVLLLNTKHTFVTVKDNKKHKPETIIFYSETKFGVDVVDQMACKYTTKAASFRWPLQVFFNILDLAAINAWILYKECTGSKIFRKDFLFQLTKELAEGETEEYKNTDHNFSIPTTSKNAGFVKSVLVNEIGATTPENNVRNKRQNNGLFFY